MGSFILSVSAAGTSTGLIGSSLGLTLRSICNCSGTDTRCFSAGMGYWVARFVEHLSISSRQIYGLALLRFMMCRLRRKIHRHKYRNDIGIVS